MDDRESPGCAERDGVGIGLKEVRLEPEYEPFR
jgi:hypothetical protein